MNIIPKVKILKLKPGKCSLDKLMWIFASNTDERVINAANNICSTNCGTKVYISHGAKKSEAYTIDISEDRIDIKSDGAAGAFYALMTLRMIKNTKGENSCCHIEDSPDMEYRGFYHDATRGRVPTLKALKKLADTMAQYKMNSLQLYIEHTYDFKEYDFCKEKLGYLTKAEIKELDTYCRERFIELIPSLSTFGHLYHLLSSDKYRHLCELRDYRDTHHYYLEKMLHHTINPLLDESFELIASLIDQHMEAFSSDKFNICCDETFDLGTDVNKGKDKGELYVGFVKKLITYLEAKGKKVMMWGDIILKHRDKISQLSNNIIFLNWDYEKDPSEDKFAALKDKVQIVCPGTSSWHGFHERISKEESNILTLASYGAKYKAKGMLNTNWGDLGTPASMEMAMYGLILGACASWCTATKAEESFRRFISEYYYGCADAISILSELSDISTYSDWLRLNWTTYHSDWETNEGDSREHYLNAMEICNKMTEKIKKAEFKNDNIKKEFLVASEGDSFIISWNARRFGHDVKSNVDFKRWLNDFKEIWLSESKRAELDTLTNLFESLYYNI